jgi:hypothetical protein
MNTLNQKPGPSGSGGSALLQQLRGSVLIAECAGLIEEARATRSRPALNKAGALIGSDEFKDLPEAERMNLHNLFAEAFVRVTGYGA